MGYYYYLLFMLPAILLGAYAQIKVKSTFSKYSKVQAGRGMTGAYAAQMVLQQNGVTGVNIERVAGSLTDHYDPRTNTIRLSESVFDSASVAAVGVAAHEAGHAVQHATGYAPVKIRTALVPTVNLASSVSVWLVLIGLLLSGMEILYFIGIFAFAVCTLFHLVTLPVELNASRRAVSTVSNVGYFSDDEIKGAKRVLTAAALTYVAALLTSVMQLFYYISLGNNRRRR